MGRRFRTVHHARVKFIVSSSRTTRVHRLDRGYLNQIVRRSYREDNPKSMSRRFCTALLTHGVEQKASTAHFAVMAAACALMLPLPRQR